jgi:PPOX class probable F420-dependent enzyme
VLTEEYSPTHTRVITYFAMPAIDNFRDHKVVVIESYGSDKKPVLTCCYFVEKDGRIFTRSPVSTQNVERIRHCSSVRLAPSRADSIPCGEWIEGSAAVRSECESGWVQRAMRQKYGWSRVAKLVAAWFKRGCRRREYAIIEIEPVSRQAL